MVEIDELPSETTDNKITLKWKEPKSNGKVITMYTVYLRVMAYGRVGQWTEIRKIRDVSVRELKIALERGKVYQFAVTATNELGESLKQEEANMQQIKAEKKKNLNQWERFYLWLMYEKLFCSLFCYYISVNRLTR